MAAGQAVNAGNPRRISLNELNSAAICIRADAESGDLLVPIRQVPCDSQVLPGTVVEPCGPVIDHPYRTDGNATFGKSAWRSDDGGLREPVYDCTLGTEPVVWQH